VIGDLLNGEALAERLGRHRTFVTAMKRAGYRFKHPALGRTTAEHAIEALDRCPEFIAGHYLLKGWKRLPRILAEPEHQTAEVAGKRG
jgi:hypothetical protein